MNQITLEPGKHLESVRSGFALVRKESPAVQQREPVFFAHAERAGPSSSDLLKPNDLDPVCLAYDTWRNAVLEGCRLDGTPVPLPVRIEAGRAAAAAVLDPLNDKAECLVADLDHALPRERLDMAYWRMKAAVAALPATVPLSDLADLVWEGRIPAAADFYAFAFVSRMTARVAPKDVTDTAYSPEQMQSLEEGDVLVSGIDLVNGSVGVVGQDCAGMVVSKEYHILRAREGIDAHWLVAALRTPTVRRIIEGTVTGTSNRTRVESPAVLMALRMAPPPGPDAQRASGDMLRASHERLLEAGQAIAEAERLALLC